MRVPLAEKHETIVVLDDAREKVLMEIGVEEQNSVSFVSSTSKRAYRHSPHISFYLFFFIF